MKQRAHSKPVSVVVAAALLVLLAAALAGALAFAPAAAASPDATQLDAFLTQHGSPMAGTGATFIAEGQLYGVDPVFLVAISGAETSFGKLLYSEDGDQCTFNAFNWFYGPTWPTSDFTSWGEGIARVAEGLGGPLYHGVGLYSVDAIAPKYCPDGTEQWITNVKAFMIELGGNPDDTRIAAAGATPSPSPTPPSSEPGLVALSGSVKLDSGDREVGQRIYAWFTLTNTGGQPLELEGIRMAIRGPGRTVRDLVSDEPLTLGRRPVHRGVVVVAARPGRPLARLDRGHAGRQGEPGRRPAGVRLLGQAAQGPRAAALGAARLRAQPGALTPASPARPRRLPPAPLLRSAFGVIS